MGYMNCVWPEERTKTQGYNEHHRPLTTVIQLNSWFFVVVVFKFYHSTKTRCAPYASCTLSFEFGSLPWSAVCWDIPTYAI